MAQKVHPEIEPHLTPVDPNTLTPSDNTRTSGAKLGTPQNRIMDDIMKCNQDGTSGVTETRMETPETAELELERDAESGETVLVNERLTQGQNSERPVRNATPKLQNTTQITDDSSTEDKDYKNAANKDDNFPEVTYTLVNGEKEPPMDDVVYVNAVNYGNSPVNATNLSQDFVISSSTQHHNYPLLGMHVHGDHMTSHRSEVYVTESDAGSGNFPTYYYPYYAPEDGEGRLMEVEEDLDFDEWDFEISFDRLSSETERQDADHQTVIHVWSLVCELRAQYSLIITHPQLCSISPFLTFSVFYG